MIIEFNETSEKHRPFNRYIVIIIVLSRVILYFTYFYAQLAGRQEYIPPRARGGRGRYK